MSKTDQEVLADQDDLEMMQRDHLWVYDYLPLKRWKDGTMETAVLAPPNDTDQGRIVFHGANIFGRIDREVRVIYPNTQAVVDAGWRVD